MLIGVLAACGDEAEPTATPTATSTVAPAPTATATSAAAPTTTPAEPTATQKPPPDEAMEEATDTDIKDFTLQDITVKKWTNRDSVPHTTTSGKPDGKTDLWDSGRLNQGGAFSFTFAEAGTFDYFCAIHPRMQATITVTDGEAAAVPPTPTTAPTQTPTAAPTAMATAEPTATTPAATATPTATAEPTATTAPPESSGEIVASNIANFSLKDLTVSDDTFKFTFTEAGTFNYFCTIHPNMHATVTVTDGEAAAAEPSPEPTAAAEPQLSTSNIANFRLQDVTVSVGDSVEWTNIDSAPHTVTSGESPDPSGVWDRGNLNKDSKFKFTFTEAGTFDYFCKIHPSMQATVTVAES